MSRTVMRGGVRPPYRGSGATARGACSAVDFAWGSSLLDPRAGAVRVLVAAMAESPACAVIWASTSRGAPAASPDTSIMPRDGFRWAEAAGGISIDTGSFRIVTSATTLPAKGHHGLADDSATPVDNPRRRRHQTHRHRPGQHRPQRGP